MTCKVGLHSLSQIVLVLFINNKLTREISLTCLNMSRRTPCLGLRPVKWALSRTLALRHSEKFCEFAEDHALFRLDTCFPGAACGQLRPSVKNLSRHIRCKGDFAVAECALLIWLCHKNCLLEGQWPLAASGVSGWLGSGILLPHALRFIW